MPNMHLRKSAGATTNMPPLPPVPMPALPQAPQPPPALAAPPLLERDLMPALPAAPWRPVGPSARVVQQAYVDRRLDDLADVADQDVRMTLTALRQDLMERMPPNQRRTPSKKALKAAYAQIERNLQSADLTINFNALSWFAERNRHDAYTQMYERAVGADGTMVLKDNAFSEARMRAGADNQVTFPTSWQHAKAGRRGLSPAGPTGLQIRERMHTGKLQYANKAQGYLAQNPRFNVRTKQIFAALNYGRRPHGAADGYGRSFLVLKPGLKERALYYPTDTFSVFSAKLGVEVQTSFARLGTLYGKVGQKNYHFAGTFRDQVLAACYDGRVLSDGSTAAHLLEAHLFGELRFQEHVSYLVLSHADFTHRNDLRFSDDDEDAYQGPEWRTILANARDFAERTGVKLYQMD